MALPTPPALGPPQGGLQRALLLSRAPLLVRQRSSRLMA